MEVPERFKKYFEVPSDVAVCIFDANGYYLYMNDAFLRIRNISYEEYQGITPYDLYNNHLIDKCILDSVYKNHTTTTDVQTIMSKDGKTVLRKHLVTIRPILDDSGSIEYSVACYKDLSAFNLEYDSHSAPTHIPHGESGLLNFIRQPKSYDDEAHPAFVARSASMQQLCHAAQQVAALDSTILITGETGTGKEVFANYLHSISSRSGREFVVVDCASLPDELIESELFGYEKGSFTGALANGKKGLFESAQGSTLFLDEINSLPLPLQGKLLRVIETKSIRRLGSTRAIPVDFRLIAATNVDLSSCVADKTFRADLYYRLNVLPFHLPPLRERKDDIIPLAEYFLYNFQKQYGTTRRLTSNLYREMLIYDWPGNVRELRNFVERSLLMGTDSPHLSPSPDPKPAAVQPRPEPAAPSVPDEAGEKELIMKALAANGHHREKTAKALNISRRTLQYKLKKYNIT